MVSYFNSLYNIPNGAFCLHSCLLNEENILKSQIFDQKYNQIIG